MSENYLKDGDSLICFNFRPDRARQIVKALSLNQFSDFERKNYPNLEFVTLISGSVKLAYAFSVLSHKRFLSITQYLPQIEAILPVLNFFMHESI